MIFRSSHLGRGVGGGGPVFFLEDQIGIEKGVSVEDLIQQREEEQESNYKNQ